MTPITSWPHEAARLLPGLLLSAVVALAATFVSEHYGGPKFLYALLLGIAFHFLSDNERCQEGVEFAAKKLVRIGVALLGCKILVSDVHSLGVPGVVALAAALLATIAFGIVMARMLGQSPQMGLLSGGATAICGISATMAISSTMVQDAENERCTLMTAIGIATLSTTAMVLYPLWVNLLGMTPAQAGLFLGGAIHDVAQVVGAGNIVSPEVAKLATLAKMFRVAMLVPVVLVLALVFRGEVARSAAGGCASRIQREVGAADRDGMQGVNRSNGRSHCEDEQRSRPPESADAHAAEIREAHPQGGVLGRRPPILPFFLVAFIALVVANSLGWIPPRVQAAANETSSLALVISIAALGVKTSFEKIAQLGWRPIALLIGETLFIAAFMTGVILLMP